MVPGTVVFGATVVKFVVQRLGLESENIVKERTVASIAQRLYDKTE